MSECMQIAESIYEGVVKTSYKKPTREDAKHAGHNRLNKGEYSSSNN